MNIVVFVVLGLMIGLLVNAVGPQRRAMGLFGSALVGIAGALIGGVAGALLGPGDPNQLGAASVLGSAAGAALLAILVQLVRPRRAART
ncbi:MAG TPA: hypothetical protein VIM73_12230 [Polyangiaceae bacterium]